MPRKFKEMDRSEVEHEARVMGALVLSMLNILRYDYVNSYNFPLDEFLDKVTEDSDCDVVAVWNNFQVLTDAEIKDRLREQFTELEISRIKDLI